MIDDRRHNKREEENKKKLGAPLGKSFCWENNSFQIVGRKIKMDQKSRGGSLFSEARLAENNRGFGYSLCDRWAGPQKAGTNQKRVDRRGRPNMGEEGVG